MYDVEAVTKRFFQEDDRIFGQVMRLVKGLPDEEERKLFWQTLFKRLVLLYFLQRKGWLTFKGYLQAVFPRSKDQERRGEYPRQWNDVREFFEIGDRDLFALRGTLWNAYNAITRYEDYRQAKESSPDRRLNRIWFGDGADPKLRALWEAQKLAKRWAA